MLRNYTTEDDVKRYIPNLDDLVFTDETDWSDQKLAAETEVLNDVIMNRYDNLLLRNDLLLRSSGTTITASETGTTSDADVFNRLRWLYNITPFTGDDTTLTLQGSQDGSIWESLSAVTVTEAVDTSVIISKVCKYFRTVVTITGTTSMDFSSSMTETSFDLLFLFKWCSIIYRTLYKSQDDQYYLKMLEFEKKYSEVLQSIRIFTETDTDGVYSESNNRIISMLK